MLRHHDSFTSGCSVWLQWQGWLGVAVFGFAVVLFAPGCATGSKTRQSQRQVPAREAYDIKATLDRLEELVENKRLEDAMETVSSRYVDQQGRDRDAIRLYLQEMFAQYQHISISRGEYFDLRFTDDSYKTACVVEQFSLVAEPYSSALYTLRVSGFVEIWLAKERDRWVIVRWGQFYPAKEDSSSPGRVVIERLD